MKRFLAITGYGKAMWVLSTAFIMVFMFCIVIHPFLSYHHPVDSEILIVEGWLGAPFLPLAVEEFYRGHYRQIVTVGGPLSISLQTDDYSNYAQLGAFRLKALGIDSQLITPVPAPHVKGHKTYAYAQAFRDWIVRSDHNVNAVNVFSGSVHSRKSYLLFQKVLGNDIKVGIISAPPQRYDPRYWWSSRRGIWLVFKNTIAYLEAFWIIGGLLHSY